MANTPSPGALVIAPADLSPDAMVDVRQGPTSSQVRSSSFVGAGALPRGTFTANGTSAVTVANANVTANSIILFTPKTVAGTPAGAPYVSSITPGTGFDVKAGSGDTSVYNYVIQG